MDCAPGGLDLWRGEPVVPPDQSAGPLGGEPGVLRGSDGLCSQLCVAAVGTGFGLVYGAPPAAGFWVWAAGPAGLPLAGIFPGESPYLAAWVGFALGLLGVFLWGKCRGKKCFVLALSASLVLALVLGYLEPRGEQFRVTVLDVGQGQCILLQTKESTYVVDCGGPAGEGAGEKAARHLLTQGRTRVDGLILTHFDEDHVSGARQLLERLSVERVYMPNAPEDETCTDLAEAAGEGAYFVEEDLHLTMGEAELWIFAPLSRTTSNESGLSVLFTAGECDTLITGDMNQNLERRLLATHALPDIELLVAGHHGAKSSTGTDLLEELRPEVVAVSVGVNSYGHRRLRCWSGRPRQAARFSGPMRPVH